MIRSSLRFFPWWVAVPAAVSLAVAAGSVGCSSDSTASSANDDDTSSSSGGNGSSGSEGTSSSSGGSSGTQTTSSSGGSSGSSGTGSSSGSSLGTGGITCERMRNLDVAPDASTREACQATEGGAEYRFVMPANPSGPLNLAVYLHGDGAAAHNNNGAMEVLLPWLDAHNAMMVSVRAPNTCSWWLKTDFDCPLERDASVTQPDRDLAHANATALDAVFKKLRAAYDIVNGPIFYYGSSGGSVFLTNSFFPKFGNVYPGAFAINCGGEVPLPGTFTWDPSDATQRGSSKFWFTYTDQDYLLESEQATVAHYRGLGFPLTEKVLPGGHCQFQSHGRAGEVWSEFLGE